MQHFYRARLVSSISTLLLFFTFLFVHSPLFANVVDITPPVITLIGSDTINLEFSEDFTDPGVDVDDDLDNTAVITSRVIATSNANTRVPGDYTIRYNVSDFAGNAAEEVIRTIIVAAPVAPPEITLNGDARIYHEIYERFEDPGADCTDNMGNPIPVVTSGVVKKEVPGEYTIKYNAIDSEGNSAIETARTVIVYIPNNNDRYPIITLNNDPVVVLETGGVFVESGATAHDPTDGDITEDMSVAGLDSVNTDVPGTYTISYSVYDSEGNYDEVIRKVIVVDPADITDLSVEYPDWTTPQPSQYVIEEDNDNNEIPLTDIGQTGTRLIYISSSEGDDGTGEMYFWNGTHIVDQSKSEFDSNGNLYGTDPANPTGLVKPYKRWAYVAPRTYPGDDVGTAWNGARQNTPGGTAPITRNGFPDWWMFKRGDTFSLYDDLFSFAVEGENDPVESISRGSLAVSGGRSELERQVVGAYGSLDTPRPRFINGLGGGLNGFINREGSLNGQDDPKHTLYTSLYFDARKQPDLETNRPDDMERGRGFSFSQLGDGAIDLRLEDLWIDGSFGNYFRGKYGTSGELTLFRCIITDAFSNSDKDHVQGLNTKCNHDGVLRIIECIFMRNGFCAGDPALSWPPSVSNGQTYDVYNRNLYLNGEFNNYESGVFNTISMIGSSGDQFRPGMQIKRNFFYQGFVKMGGFGGYESDNFSTGAFTDNVLQKFKASGSSNNNGHPGLGIELTSGSSNVEVSGNIVTSAQFEENDYAFKLSALNWAGYSHLYRYPTRNNLIHDNIFDSSIAPEAIVIEDGSEYYEDSNGPYGPDGFSYYEYPGIQNNAIINNIIVNASEIESNYKPLSNVPAGSTHDTIVDNSIYPTREDAGSENNWTDPDRTLKKYLIDLEYRVISDDGFIEFFEEAKKMRKGTWKEELTARAINNYIRQGFNLESY